MVITTTFVGHFVYRLLSQSAGGRVVNSRVILTVHGTALKNTELHDEKMILLSFSSQFSDYIKEKVSAWCYSSTSIMLANLSEPS